MWSSGLVLAFVFVHGCRIASSKGVDNLGWVIMDHEEYFFFCFWPFVNVQELLEVTTKLPIKLNDPVIDVGTYCMCQLSKVP
jgi:hypothetical protein